MRFITRTVLSSLLAMCLPLGLRAQHGLIGGGHSSAPAARGIAPGLGHFFAPSRSGTLPPGLTPPAASYTGIRPGALRSFCGRGNFGRDYRRVPYAYFFAPYYYPFLDYASAPYSDSGYGYGYGYGPEPADPDPQAMQIAEQLNQLHAEIDDMKYAQQGMAPPPPAPQQDAPPSTPVTLVLRNGQQLRVQNYAVMDETFWDFTAQPTRKIPIANIDVAASAKATIANGGEFPQLEGSTPAVQ
jgi:hypothetical protein